MQFVDGLSLLHITYIIACGEVEDRERKIFFLKWERFGDLQALPSPKPHHLYFSLDCEI